MDAERLAEQNERDLHDLAYAASHDLQAPIWHVRGFVDLLLRHLVEDLDVQLDEKSEQYRDFAMSGLDRLQAMIDGLLEYSRIATATSPFTEVDLAAAIRNAIKAHKPLADEADATVAVGALPVIEGDAAQISRLMWHLVANALTFRATDRPLRIEIEATTTGDRCELRVSDTGQGIDDEALDLVLGILRRNHSDDVAGAGMGLAVCRRIVERHNGDIRLESKVDVGTTVVITLPLKQAA